MSNSQKVVLVTGCTTGGIGYHIANEFGKAGCKTYASSRRVETMDYSHNPNVKTIALDVTSDESVNGVIKYILDEEGKIDIVVCNAGLFHVAPLIDHTIERTKALFDTNVYGLLRMAKAVLPHMASRKDGLIVSVGSVDGEIPTPFSGVYDSSKAAQHAMTEVLGMEARALGVNVFLVSPGAVTTNIVDNSAKDFKLNPDSIYKPYEKKIVERLHVSRSMPDTWKADRFGQEVVKRALQKNPPWYWSGGGAAWKMKLLKMIPRTWALQIVWNALGAM
ncbi:NAD-binding protein [Cristinia sonorae]|uniref:NAD-binding protein n=1 Tax=Cristinia sonorae TaxID=1940300 RepID=A0A8K0UXP8_9AGAR|nr:NAD-binding protein [Cristinia sonorae]